MDWKRNSSPIPFLDKPHLYYYFKLNEMKFFEFLRVNDWLNPVRKDGALILPFL